VDATGQVMPPRRTPSQSSALARARWHTAADWVESYSGVLWQDLNARLLAEERARHDTRAAMSEQERAADGRPRVLLLDDVPVTTKALDDGHGSRRVKRTYFVLAAGTLTWGEPTAPATRAWQRAGQPDSQTRLRLLRGFATNEAESWLLLFRELGFQPGVYEPEVVLADAGTGLGKAVRSFFPGAVLVPTIWHVQQAVVEALTKRSGPGAMVLTDHGLGLHPRLSDLLLDLSAAALRTRSEQQWRHWWDDLETVVDALGLAGDAVAARRAVYEPAIAQALPVLTANPTVPVSTGGFETVIRQQVSSLLAGREHALTNIERCAGLFDLAVCHAHGVFAHQSTVMDALRADAVAAGRDGWAAAPRTMADAQPPMPARYSSLRDRNLPAALASRWAAA
jgi:hypothetical protein